MKTKRWELAGLAIIVSLAGFFLRQSWRKWPDPIIDFGRELYIPWRLSEGAVLYRDADDFYGPLSQYLNAGLFTVFGPGMMVLVAANLIVFALIAAGLYLLFRRAWGSLAAFVAVALFVSVFGFSQFQGVGNNNYATPYAHETTHGMLVCVILVWVLLDWIERGTTKAVFAAGLLWGLTAVLKPEFMLAGALLTIAALAIRWKRSGAKFSPATGGIWLAAAALPSVLFAAYFATKMPMAEACDAAGRAWLNVFRYGGEFIQTKFLGLDQPWHNLWVQLASTLIAGGTLLFLGFAAGRLERLGNRARRVGGSIALVAIVTILVWRYVNWGEIGRCLPGVVVAYLAFKFVVAFSRRPLAVNPPREAARILLAVLAAALLSRMLLHGRLTQFGYYQAAIAAIIIPAVTVGELPEWFLLGSLARRTVTLGCVAIVVIGAVVLANFSNGLLRLKTFQIGSGRDMFYTYGPETDPVGVVAQAMIDHLPRQPADQTLLVLPEGLMLNYLARVASPLPPFFYFSAATEHGREAQLAQQLDLAPPAHVVVISRGFLAEYGITRYGEAPGKGQQLLRWVESNYQPAATIGHDPLQDGERAAILYSRRPSSSGSEATPSSK